MTIARPDEPVSRLVHRGPVTVEPDATLRDISVLLVREEVGVALVTRDAAAIGLVSERDIVRAIAEGADVDDDRVDDVMTFEVVSVGPQEPVGSAARQMLEGEIRHLLVSDDGRSVGVISMRDVLAVCVD